MEMGGKYESETADGLLAPSQSSHTGRRTRKREE